MPRSAPPRSSRSATRRSPRRSTAGGRTRPRRSRNGQFDVYRPMLAPGATIGILGGGQLGRMTALAAARLGYRTHVFATEPDSPAAQVCAAATGGAYDGG